MRRLSGVLAFMAGAALIVTTTGAAVGQEESPVPEVVEPSTLSIDQIAHDRLAQEPLQGKAYAKAIAKAAPNAVRYLIDSSGADDIERIVELSLLARAMEDAGDAAAAGALIDLATLVYRGSWTAANSDPVSLNSDIEAFIAAGDYPEQDRALALWSDGDMGVPGYYDLCLKPDDSWTYHDPAKPSRCENDGGRQVRASSEAPWVGYTPLAERLENQPSAEEMFRGLVPDAGGLGIHKIVQDKTADDKLAGKKYQKALAKAIKKQGPAIATYLAGGSGAGLEQGVIEMVLLARAADEAGDAKAAAAFMDLALATYRSGVPELSKTFLQNALIAQSIEADYAGVPGLQLRAPDGMTDVCFTPAGECMWGVDGNVPWECEISGGVVKRLPREEAVCA